MRYDFSTVNGMVFVACQWVLYASSIHRLVRIEGGSERRLVMRTPFLADQEQPARASRLGLEDMLSRVRAEVEAIAKQAHETRRQIRRGQTPTAGPGLLVIENRCLNALAVLDTVEPTRRRSRASDPSTRETRTTMGHTTVSERVGAAL
jgi:hypothetical protein